VAAQAHDPRLRTGKPLYKTETHVQRLVQVADGPDGEALAGLIKEGEQLMDRRVGSLAPSNSQLM